MRPPCRCGVNRSRYWLQIRQRKLNWRFPMNRFLVVVCIIGACAALASAQTATPSPSPVDPCAEITKRAARAEAKLKDWPALARYRDANAKTGAPNADEARVVFIGGLIPRSWDGPKDGGLFPRKAYLDRRLN